MIQVGPTNAKPPRNSGCWHGPGESGCLLRSLELQRLAFFFLGGGFYGFYQRSYFSTCSLTSFYRSVLGAMRDMCSRICGAPSGSLSSLYVELRFPKPKTQNPKPLNREARRPSRSSHFSGLGCTSVLSLRNLLVSFYQLSTMIGFHVPIV